MCSIGIPTLTFDANTNNLAQRTWGTYVNKKLMIMVALAELQKLVNWAQVVFNSLHSKLQDLTIAVKLKKNKF